MSCSGSIHKELDHSVENRGQAHCGTFCGVCGGMAEDHREESEHGDFPSSSSLPPKDLFIFSASSSQK